jgi:hypothetical protein
VLRKRVNGALLLAGSRAISLMAESSSNDKEGDRCTLLTAGGGGEARGVERTRILEHEREEGGADDKRGWNRDNPRPSPNALRRGGLRSGEWRRE